MRQGIHTVVALGFWLLLGLMWAVLIWQHKVNPHSLLLASGTVLAIAATTSIITLYWIAHNLRTFHRKGPRRGRPTMQPRTDVDKLGRAVIWDFPQGHLEAGAAGNILIEVGQDTKRYVSGGSTW